MWIRELCLFHTLSQKPLVHIRLGPQKAEGTMLLGMITAIENFSREFARTNQRLKKIDQGDYKILIEFGKWVTICAVAKRDMDWLRGRMILMLHHFEEKFQTLLQSTPEDISPFQVFHGEILENIPEQILIQENAPTPKRKIGIQQVPFYPSEPNGFTGDQALVCKLSDGTRSIHDIAEIMKQPYFEVVRLISGLKSKGLRIESKFIQE